MEHAYQKYKFSAISIKKDTAERFRKFSREVSGSHTDTLESMLNFFKWNSLSPNDNLGVTADGTKKRINALIAIVRNIENQQTLPTKAMLDTLFKEISQVENVEKEELEENFDFGSPEIFTKDNELEYYRNRYEEMQHQFSQHKNQVQELLEQMTYVKGTFGKGHYKLDMDKNEFENFKKEL